MSVLNLIQIKKNLVADPDPFSFFNLTLYTIIPKGSDFSYYFIIPDRDPGFPGVPFFLDPLPISSWGSEGSGFFAGSDPDQGVDSDPVNLNLDPQL